MDSVHFLIVATVIGGVFLALWWVGNEKRRRYMTAQTALFEAQMASLKSNDQFLAASRLNSDKQTEILERIARALETRA